MAPFHYYDVLQRSSSSAKLFFSTVIGGSGDDMVASMGLDGVGNIYIAGLTDSPDFPVTEAGQDSEPASGAKTIFIMKAVMSVDHVCDKCLKFVSFLFFRIRTVTVGDQGGIAQ